MGNVVTTALWLSALSFAVFCIAVVGKLLIEFYQQRGAPQGGPLNQLPEPAWVDAVARLIEALKSASPALLSLLASITFLAIAYVAAGRLPENRPPEPPPPKDAQSPKETQPPKDTPSLKKESAPASDSGNGQTKRPQQ